MPRRKGTPQKRGADAPSTSDPTAASARKKPTPRALRAAAADLRTAEGAIEAAVRRLPPVAIAPRVPRSRNTRAPPLSAVSTAAEFGSERVRAAARDVATTATTLRRDLAELKDRLSGLQDAAASASGIASGPLVSVKVAVWLRAQNKDGEAILSASQEKLRRVRDNEERDTVYDGDNAAYITFKDGITDVVPKSAVSGVQISESVGEIVYWNEESLATWPMEDRGAKFSIARDLVVFMNSAPQIQAVVDTMSSASYLGIEFKYISSPFERTHGLDRAAEVTSQPLLAGALVYRQSNYSALDVTELCGVVDNKDDDAPAGPQRCVLSLLLQQYAMRVSILQSGAVTRINRGWNEKRGKDWKVSGQKRQYTDIEFTAEGLHKFLGLEGEYSETADIALNLVQLRKVCEYFDIPLSVIDGNGDPIVEACHEPTRRGFARLNVQMADGHLYNLNAGLRHLQRRVTAALLSFAKDADEAESVVSSEDTESVAEDEDGTDVIGGTHSLLFKASAPQTATWLDNPVYDMAHYDYSSVESGVTVMRFETDVQLVSEVVEPLMKLGIVPALTFACGRVTGVSLRLRFFQAPTKPGDSPTERVVVAVVSTPMSPPGEVRPDVGRAESEAAHVSYEEVAAPFFQQATVSMFADLHPTYAGGPQLGTIMRDLPMGALHGRFDLERPLMAYVYAYDQTKAHTSALVELSSCLPVFYYDDCFKEVRLGDAEDDNSIYIVVRPIGVRTHGTGLRRDSPVLVVLSHHMNLVTGRTLALVMEHPDFGEHFRVVASVKPSRIINVRNEFVGALRRMYANPLLSAAIRKFVVNCVVGRLGKKSLTRGSTSVFRDFDDASMHAHLKGLDAKSVQYLTDGLYVLHDETRTTLRDHRAPIHFAVLDTVRRRNYQQLMRLQRDHPTARLAAVKTDCLYIESPTKLELLPRSTSVDDFISGAHWHSELVEEALLPLREPKVGDERPDLMPLLGSTRGFEDIVLTPEEEMDAKVVNEIIGKGDLFITSTVPGAGKSTSAMTFVRSRKAVDETLVVTPLNKLNAEYRSRGFASMTLFTLLGLSPTTSRRGETVTKVTATKKLDAYKYLIFDEWAAVPELLRMLWRPVRAANPHLLVMYIGDPRQLPAIETNLNFKGEEAEIERFTTSIQADAGRMLTLRVCKRVSSADDRRLVDALYHETWVANKEWRGRASVEKVLALLPPGRVLTRVADIPDGAAVISFHVDTAVALGIELAKREQPRDAVLVGYKKLPTGEKPFYVWQNCALRSNSNAKLGRGKDDTRLVNNGRYITLSINKDKRMVRLAMDLGSELDEVIQVSYAGVLKWFSHGAYSSTGHSWQGATITDRPIVLVDVFSHFVSRRWLWMSLTRGDDMTRVYSLQPSAAEAAAYGFGGRDWRSFMARAIAGYKAQDKAAGRVFDDADYAGVDDWWALMADTGAACSNCGQACGMVGDMTATLDRVVGTCAHLRSNVVLSCLGCNRSRH
jgi:hypothetical protein